MYVAWTAMTFLECVRKLRAALDVPPSVPLPLAVSQMSKMMGFLTEREDGTTIPLPEQVEALAEAVGVVDEAGSTGTGGDGEFDEFEEDERCSMAGTDDDGCSTPGVTAGSEASSSILKQRTVGSFFGAGINKKYKKGALVDSSLAPEHDRVADSVSGMACVCGKRFNHPPAFNIHTKFCSSVALRAALCDGDERGKCTPA